MLTINLDTYRNDYVYAKKFDTHTVSKDNVAKLLCIFDNWSYGVNGERYLTEIGNVSDFISTFSRVGYSHKFDAIVFAEMFILALAWHLGIDDVSQFITSQDYLEFEKSLENGKDFVDNSQKSNIV